jgi:hypothetical protein
MQKHYILDFGGVFAFPISNFENFGIFKTLN